MIMSRSNVLLMLLYAACWFFSESTAVERPDWLADYEHGDVEPDSASVRDMGEQLGAILRTESSWWPKTKSDGRKNGPAKAAVEAAATMTTTAVPKNSKNSNRFDSAHEFFRTLRGEKKMSTAEVNADTADRPVDDGANNPAENEPTATGVIDSEPTATAEPTATVEPTATTEPPTTVTAKTSTTVTPKQTAFSTENQCVAANNGRPCVCIMADFLKLVGRWLDDVPATAASDDDTAAVAALKCHSYKVLPESFNVTSVGDSVLVDDHPQQQITDVLQGMEVDLGQVINYRLEKSENGKISRTGKAGQVQMILVKTLS